MKNFVSPHVHVQSLDSASTPAAFVERELELETGAIAVTDHGSLAACQTVYDLAHKKKITPILGLEGYFRDDSCPILLGAGFQPNAQGKLVDTFKYGHFTTHFLDQAAFRVAIRLLSRAPIEKHGQEYKPLFSWSDMEELGAADATITTGCLIGMVQRHLLERQDPETARRYYERLRALVRPGNFYVEVFPHVCTHNWVSGVFLTVQEAGGEPTTLRYYAGKTLRTNVGEVKAEELAKHFGRPESKHTHLLAVKDYRVWNERPPARLLVVKHVEDFIQNECRPFAPGGDVQLGANEFMVQLARDHGDPILVSDDAHYAHPQEKVIQEVRLAQSGSWKFFGSYHRQSSDEAFHYFKTQMGISEKEFEGWVDNSRAWAARFASFKLESKPELPTPHYEVRYEGAGVKSSLGYAMKLVAEHGRMDWSKPEYVARLKQEIDLLYRNGTVDLLPYFFLDEEVCRLYRDAGMLTGPGRGSAAGLLLAYLLGITHVDPIRYGLSVDRFLTLDRIKSGKLPDIDQDLPSRDLLVGANEEGGWLQQRFGECVAQISTVMTLKLRSAVLDVARFKLGHVPLLVAELAHKFEMPPQGLEDVKHVLGYEDSGNWVDGSITRDPALQEYVAAYPDHWEIVQKCLGLGRGVSRHACGFVIAGHPISDFIPLTKIGGVTCTQFAAPAVEAAGGVKMDFLVVNSLRDIAAAIKMVQERCGRPVPEGGLKIDGRWVPSLRLVPTPEGGWADVWDLPEDREVFADVACGRTETVFQFNTPGAVQWLRHFAYKRPGGGYAIDSIESMAAFTALDRPGPLDASVQNPDDPEKTHNMLVEYARRARGARPSLDVLPVFDNLFPETYGVLTFQEQVQRLYQEVTGCTGAEAEEFRSNVAKKKKEKIIAAYPGFIAGAAEKLGSKEQAEAVWAFINSWAAYGFNKSHAVCYVVIAYACAYLKHHYPLEWWCAVLQNAKKEEVNGSFWRHCGHVIDLPDVTRAAPNFVIHGERIQAPLSLLHGVGEVAHAELVAGAPYSSIDDLVEKIEAHKLAGTTTKTVCKEVVDEKTGQQTVVKTEKIAKGRSALNTGVVYRLIVSGALDRLFPDGMTTEEMFEAYERARLNYENRVRAAMPKPRRPKKVPDAVKSEYLNLTQYTRYQLRKGILPAYSDNVFAMMVERKHEDVVHDEHWFWQRGGPRVRFVDLGGYDYLRRSPVPEDGFGDRVAVAGYVEEVRPFRYGEDKEKSAVELTLDLEGERVKVVAWPDRETGKLSQHFQKVMDEGLKGALVVLVMSRFKTGRPFSVDRLGVVQPPLGSSSPKTEKEEEDS